MLDLSVGGVPKKQSPFENFCTPEEKWISVIYIIHVCYLHFSLSRLCQKYIRFSHSSRCTDIKYSL